MIAPRALSNTDPVAPSSGASTLTVPVTVIVPRLIKDRFRTEPEGTASHVYMTGSDIFDTAGED